MFTWTLKKDWFFTQTYSLLLRSCMPYSFIWRGYDQHILELNKAALKVHPKSNKIPHDLAYKTYFVYPCFSLIHKDFEQSFNEKLSRHFCLDTNNVKHKFSLIYLKFMHKGWTRNLNICNNCKLTFSKV